MKRYLRGVIEHFPHAAAESHRAFGWRGAYLAACAYVLRYQPFPVSLPRFGKVDSWGEAINLVDNFGLGELRSESVEHHLRTLPAALVVDVGVNIGITCRWWLSLANDLEVVGIDMFQEALDFTTERVARIRQDNRWHPVCGAVGAGDGVAEVRFKDPLEGTSRLDSSSGENSRTMRVQALDAVIAPIAPKRIGLLKLDIEGSAGRALRGASETLAKCDYVVVETHSDEETRMASQELTRAGFQLFRCHGRTMGWQREA